MDGWNQSRIDECFSMNIKTITRSGLLPIFFDRYLFVVLRQQFRFLCIHCLRFDKTVALRLQRIWLH